MNRLVGLIAFSLLFFSCGQSPKSKYNVELQALQAKADLVNRDFRKIRLEIDVIASQIEELYKNQDSILLSINRSKYEFANNGVFYKPVDDGGSAIFVSGFYPIDKEVQKIVFFTEPIDTPFVKLVSRYPEIVQVYYNDKNSINRIYPFFDVLSQYEARMDIPSFNFYYMADAKHNPDHKSLWLSEPYVDPAGRGWMISAISPVYFKGVLAGVAGIDVTINLITQRYVLDNPKCMTMIVDNTGAIVTAQENVINLLSFPPLFDHKYIETIKQDTYRKEVYNLRLSKTAEIRRVAVDLLEKHKSWMEAEINGEKVTFLSVLIPELNWHLIDVIQ
jgi:hypothetical protein